MTSAPQRPALPPAVLVVIGVLALIGALSLLRWVLVATVRIAFVVVLVALVVALVSGMLRRGPR